MKTTFAQIISYVFHPLGMPLYALILFYSTDPYFELFMAESAKKTAFFLFLGMTLIGPLLLLSAYRYTGTIDNFSDPNKSSRIMIAIVILAFYGMSYYFFKKIHLPLVYYHLFFSIIISIAIATFISYFYKISMHGLAVGGILGAQGALFLLHDTYNFYILFVLILICGLVGTARLILKAHTQDQVYTGTFLGFLSVSTYLLLKQHFFSTLADFFVQNSF